MITEKKLQVELKKEGNNYSFYLNGKKVGFVYPTQVHLYSEDEQGFYDVEGLKTLGEKHGTPIVSDGSDGYLAMVYKNDMGLLHSYWALTGQKPEDFYSRKRRKKREDMYYLDTIYYIKDKKTGSVIEEAPSYEEAVKIVKKYEKIDKELDEAYGEEEKTEYVISEIW